jgi:hypothetical protein
MSEPYLRRRVVDIAARGFCVVMTVLAIVPLFSLLGYVIKQGAGGLSWSFFTELPKPVGEVGGGMGNAIAGSGILVGLACAIGMPVGVLAGVYLAEFGKNRFGNAVRGLRGRAGRDGRLRRVVVRRYVVQTGCVRPADCCRCSRAGGGGGAGCRRRHETPQ